MSDDLFEQTGPDRQMCINELLREVRVRERLYPAWTEAGKIDPKTAAHRILCLRAAIAMLREGP
jgi:hypothetical protein